MVDSLPGQNVMGDGQKFNTLPNHSHLTCWTKCDMAWSEIQQDHGQLTPWIKCDARWSEIQQHLVKQWTTHKLDKMWCEMVSNSTIPCKMTDNSLPGWNVMQDGQEFNSTLQNNGWLTVWTKCSGRRSEFQQHLARPWSTHILDKMSCEMVRNSTPCKTTDDSLPGWNVTQDGQKFNTLQNDNPLTVWTKCDARWSEIQQHLARSWSTHILDKMWCKMVREIQQHLIGQRSTHPLNARWSERFNNTLQDNGRLTAWTKCDVR